jgi:hypothetical protein
MPSNYLDKLGLRLPTAGEAASISTTRNIARLGIQISHPRSGRLGSNWLVAFTGGSFQRVLRHHELSDNGQTPWSNRVQELLVSGASSLHRVESCRETNASAIKNSNNSRRGLSPHRKPRIAKFFVLNKRGSDPSIRLLFIRVKSYHTRFKKQ